MIDSGRRSDLGGSGGATRPPAHGCSPIRLLCDAPGHRRRRPSLSRRKISVADNLFPAAAIGFLLQRSLAQRVAHVSAGWPWI